jgi:hypothetical protein
LQKKVGCGGVGGFAGVFAKSGWFEVVFLWSSCGGLCGERGQLTVDFSATEIGTGI